MMHTFGNGSELYQKRALKALPRLVALAKAGRTITYGQLARQLKMPNPQNLNYVLGTIGDELRALSKEWKVTIPPIQCLVVNNATHLPSRGIGTYMDSKKFQKLPLPSKRQILHELNADIFGYSKWDDVLLHFGLTPINPKKETAEITTKARYGKNGGEGESHRLLKDYIANNPHAIGLPPTPNMEKEYPFASADKIDILFQYSSTWVGVEVKGPNSDEADLMRGIFQCVKYRALIEATQRHEQRKIDSRVILAIGRSLPDVLDGLADLLDVEVLSTISVPVTSKAAVAKA